MRSAWAASLVVSLTLAVGTNRASADDPTAVVEDLQTHYGRITMHTGCIGPCELLPVNNQYIALGGSFKISRITFEWANTGSNNCNQMGHYEATLAANPDGSSVVATSLNAIYLGCGRAGSGGSAELTFSGESVPATFYLTFRARDQMVQALAF